EIAFALGYVSPFYFTQAFTRRSGMSPSEYRSQFRQPNL
ncbi:MAG: AraC family transcriptional regulator, partial [Anaerolineales bacterium]|nr:AraC family transcriptional regulator [Anaerolineales bacterium]